MRNFERIAPPPFLAEKGAEWGRDYRIKKNDNPSYVFQWKQHNHQKVNHWILPFLSRQTQEHCSYCDAYPMKRSDETIDHFHPKGNPLFYHLAYTWANLYFCCAACQVAKMERFHSNLLRPDAADYRFERYFITNFSTGELQPNPAASSEDQTNAQITIDILDLNHRGQMLARCHSIERSQLGDIPIDDLAYRFLFE